MKDKTVIITAVTSALFFFSFLAAEAATVTGTITGEGGQPARIDVTKDKAVCGKKPLFSEDLILSKKGGLKNAVVEIMGAGTAKPGRAAITQSGCRFMPHVIAVTAGSEITVKNDDGISHNFHSLGFENDSVNFSQPGDMKTRTISGENFEIPEVLQVKCDIHGWMKAWIVVTEGSHADVTDENGRFTIKNVPAGSYKIKVWHESLGEIIGNIAVKEGTNIFNLKMK